MVTATFNDNNQQLRISNDLMVIPDHQGHCVEYVSCDADEYFINDLIACFAESSTSFGSFNDFLSHGRTYR